MNAAIEKRAEFNRKRYLSSKKHKTIEIKQDIQLQLPEPKKSNIENLPHMRQVENIQFLSEKINRELTAIEPRLKGEAIENNHNKENINESPRTTNEPVHNETKRRLPKVNQAIPKRTTATITELRKQYQGSPDAAPERSSVSVREIRSENQSPNVPVSGRADGNSRQAERSP
ncbi:hypothetical protein [Vibrio sp. RC27]